MNTDSHLGPFCYRSTFCLLEGKHNDFQLSELIPAHFETRSTHNHFIIRDNMERWKQWVPRYSSMKLLDSLCHINTSKRTWPSHLPGCILSLSKQGNYCCLRRGDSSILIVNLRNKKSAATNELFGVLQPSLTWKLNIHRIHIDWTTLFTTIFEWEKRLQNSSHRGYYTVKKNKNHQILAITWLLLVFHSPPPSDINPWKKHICEIMGRDN